MVDVNVAVKLYNDGNTLKYIGEVFGVSKQRIWQAIKKQGKNFTREHRKAGVILNTPSEQRFIKVLKSQGLTYKRMGRMSSFDLLVNNKKVELKYLGKASKIGKSHYFHFSCVLTSEPSDYYVFICGKTNPKHYIVPSNITKDTVNIAAMPKYQKSIEWNKKYLENWDLLKLNVVETVNST